MNEFAKALPFSITIVLEVMSSGLDETSCKELKNRPINLPDHYHLVVTYFLVDLNFQQFFDT